MLDRAEAAQILEIVDVDMSVVDLVAALQGRERANAGALFLDDRLKMNPRGGLEARGLIASSA